VPKRTKTPQKKRSARPTVGPKLLAVPKRTVQGAPRATTLEPPLNLTEGLREIAREVCYSIPDLAHVRLEAVHFTLFHSRAAERIFTFARCYPLPSAMKRRGRHWYRLTSVFTPGGVEARYILSFAWPRFWGMTPRERLETLVHELYHIGPDFDGEARSFEAGGWHGKGRAWFDAIIAELVDTHFPDGIDHPVLNVQLDENVRVTGERLRKPYWQEAFRSL
jgi:Putative phage metallopeptidase